MAPTLKREHVHAQSHTHTPAHTCTYTNAHKCTQFKRIKQIFVRVITVPNNRFGSKERRISSDKQNLENGPRVWEIYSFREQVCPLQELPCPVWKSHSLPDTMYSRRHCSVAPGCHYQHPQVGYQAVTPGQGTPWELHAHSAQTHMQVKTAIHVK